MPNRNFPCSSFLISLWQTFNHPRNLNALTVVIIRIPSVSTLFQYADFRVAQPEEEDGGGGEINSDIDFDDGVHGAASALHL